MATKTLINQKLTLIPDEYLGEVAVFLDFLHYKIENSTQTPPQRKPGIIKEPIFMADDFDLPLEDFKEYM